MASTKERIDAAYRERRSLGTPDEQTCWICERVKTRITYRGEEDRRSVAYVCSDCDQGSP